ncbi:MAG: biopolymer transporter ExbD [Gemmatimonadota bacterium]|nr:biopolymer transporter ExbD [Gemmatimonadota bacterium]
MQLYQRPKRRPSINITSLIDVLFLLLTFFLVTTSFIEQSALKVELPSMENADRVQQPKRFVLDVAPDGGIHYDGQPVERAALSVRLQTASDEINASGGLVLRADRDLPHGEVISVLDIIRGAGIRRFVIATESAGPG